MPVLLDAANFSGTLPVRRASPGFRKGASRSITIGLVNNMPDEALKATERQFLSLLDSASEGMQIRLLHYMLPDIPRQEQARRYLDSFYASVEDLWDEHLDGLIVTGREPLASNLKQEPYLESFTRLAEVGGKQYLFRGLVLPGGSTLLSSTWMVLPESGGMTSSSASSSVHVRPSIL